MSNTFLVPKGKCALWFVSLCSMRTERSLIYCGDYRFREPSKELQAKIGMTFDGTTLGRNGPVKVGYPNTLLDINVIVDKVCLFSLGYGG